MSKQPPSRQPPSKRPPSAGDANGTTTDGDGSPSSVVRSDSIPTSTLWKLGLLCSALLWVAGPPVGAFPVAMIALCPLLSLADSSRRIARGGWIGLHLGLTFYFLISLQGLRHAHPAMFLCWIALSAYLAIYPVIFVAAIRRLASRFNLVWIAPVAWVATEWIRNYLLTGISVLMLGHTQANAPAMIQIAELFGTYGVSFVLVAINVAALTIFRYVRNRTTHPNFQLQIALPILLLAATLGFGFFRLNDSQPREQLASFLLLQRNEPVVYGQSRDREIEIFQNYARDAIEAVQRAGQNKKAQNESKQHIDAVVWPESMFSGGVFWSESEDRFTVPEQANVTPEQFLEGVNQQREYILDRTRSMFELMGQNPPPHFLAGCGVVRYGERPRVYSGVLHVKPDSRVNDWYGKRHLVMFGEYIPLLPHVPLLNRLVPPELGVSAGPSTKIMNINGTRVSPNICIETAVERVTLAQMQSGESADGAPDLIVTVTNDGWFGNSSVMDHHLRCVQLSAVGCQRAILSSANNGPTAWVDHNGRVVERLDNGTEGQVTATPARCDRISLYSRWGDWPAFLTVPICAVAWLRSRVGLKAKKRSLDQAS